MRIPIATVSLLLASLSLSACLGGDGGSSPTAPEPEPLPRISITASPAPVEAALSEATDSSVTFVFPVELSFRESAGMGGRITRLVSTMIIDGSQAQPATNDVDVAVPASGTTRASFTVQFSLSELPNTLSWRIAAEGVDASGREFTVRPTSVRVVFSLPPAPSTPVPSDDVLLFGGSQHSVFLGCFSCSRFDGDSVHNSFGPYGSPFSSTSIWNEFSDYGSQFSNDSACNRFATNPPIVVTADGTFLGELTVNTIRPDAIRNAEVQQWLRNSVCEL